MSAAASTSKPGAPFLWVFGAFTSFAILLAIFLNLAKPAPVDPREPERLANKAEILKAQAELTAKMGLNDAGKKGGVFDKTLALLSSRKPAPSTQVVPGSPTQLKQAAAAPAPAPAAAPAAAAPATK
ncbi:MAG: hypothetical protein CJBNEKGG_00707 [Prosthecobacter sp.]|nr:hypothetical protein [Prosthecobacter sp.]